WYESDEMHTNRVTYSYDASNNLTSELSQYWDGSVWVLNYQYTYTYDASYNLKSVLYQHLFDIYNYQITYTYDRHSNLTRELHQDWGGSDWVNYSQFSYAY